MRPELRADLVPASQLARCASPVALPERGLTQAEAEIFWGRDRTALRTCASRHAALARTAIELTTASEE